MTVEGRRGGSWTVVFAQDDKDGGRIELLIVRILN